MKKPRNFTAAGFGKSFNKLSSYENFYTVSSYSAYKYLFNLKKTKTSLCFYSTHRKEREIKNSRTHMSIPKSESCK
jgi:hypothetical protein